MVCQLSAQGGLFYSGTPPPVKLTAVNGSNIEQINNQIFLEDKYLVMVEYSNQFALFVFKNKKNKL